VNAASKRPARTAGRQDASPIDRLPPHSIEAERGVLGCCLMDAGALDAAMLKLGDNMEAFYDLRNRTIYESLVAMRSDMLPIDLITVHQHLKDRKLLSNVGGIGYVSECIDKTPAASNLDYYLTIVCEQYLLRKLVQNCSGAVGRIYDFEGDVPGLISEVEREVLAVRQTFDRGRGRTNIAAIQQSLTDIYEAAIMQNQVAGLQTGFHDLDRKLGGLMPQEMIVVGGSPSAGKTTLALNIGFGVARAGTIVSIISMETSATKVVHRLHCLAGQLDGGGFIRGGASESELGRMMGAMQTVRDASERLFLNDTTLTDGQLQALCRQDYARGARLFVVDMLQNIQAEGKGEFERVTNASKCVKNIAKELNVPVIVTSALSRVEVNQKTGKPRRPTMHDLRQSGQIESDGDKIVLLHCDDRESDVRTVECTVAKNKDGPCGTINFTFFANQFRFETATVGMDNEDAVRSAVAD